MTLVDNDLILSKDEDIPFVINHFFSNVVSSLNMPEYEDLTTDIDQFENPVLSAKKI